MKTDLAKYKEVVEVMADIVLFFTANDEAHQALDEWLKFQYVYRNQPGPDFSRIRQIVSEAKEDIAEFERSQDALQPRYLDDVNSEDYILTHSALRMEGYSYRDETSLDVHSIIERFKSDGDFGPITPLDKLACFFLMQRFLGKWGGEYLSKNSLEWKAYRQLFLDTVDVEPPARYASKHEDLTAIWQNRIKPRIDECVKIVEEIHKNTDYTDDWKIRGEVSRSE